MDDCPYDHRKKFYIFNPLQEWKLGQKIVDAAFFGDDYSKNQMHDGTPEHLLLNDMMQHILQKNGVENRLEWRVHISKEKQLNAISYPGGRIIFYELILDCVDNADQLAMIMSHEISHILQRHCNRQISKKFLNICAMSFFFLSFDFGFSEMYFSEKMEDIFKLKHSREHEMRADEWGLKLMHRAGFDLEECPKMIKSLDKGIRFYTGDSESELSVEDAMSIPT